MCGATLQGVLIMRPISALAAVALLFLMPACTDEHRLHLFSECEGCQLRGVDLRDANLSGAEYCNTEMPDGSLNNDDCYLSILNRAKQSMFGPTAKWTHSGEFAILSGQKQVLSGERRLNSFAKFRTRSERI
jgi:uncharacterized protein YjbI with pentapeptide repeats